MFIPLLPGVRLDTATIAFHQLFLVGTPRRGVQGGRAAAQHWLVADGSSVKMRPLPRAADNSSKPERFKSSFTMRTIIFALACLTCLQLSAQVETYQGGTWSDITVAAQQTNGRIDAAGVNSGWRAWHWNENWQPTYNNSPWNAWGSGDTARGTPASMEIARDGSVISLWDDTKDGSVFALASSADFGGNCKLAGIRGPASLDRILMDSQSNLWVSELGLNLCKAAYRDNHYRQIPSLLHAITVGELWPGGNVTNRLPVSMAEDASGRIWFWSDCLLGDESRGAVHGVLLHQDGVVTNRPTLDGVPDLRITVVVPLDASHLWLGVQGAGIYSIDLDTLKGTRVAEPEPNAFQVVHNMFAVGGDRYVLSGNSYDYNSRGLRGMLWRCRAGTWTKLIDGLDNDSSSEQFADRRWRVTGEGLWLGSFGLGGWFVPLDDSPLQVINWQKNSSLDTINRWFQLKDGRMLALQFGRGGVIADASLLTQKSTLPPGLEIVRTSKSLLRTGQGKIFGVLRGDETSLNEWDGQQWQSHSFPDKRPLGGDCKIASDSKGRVWFIDALYNPDPALVPAYVFDSALGRFQKFQNLRTALQAQIEALPDFRIGGIGTFALEFSRDGRICYESEGHWRVNYFNGRQWRSWNRASEIMPGVSLQSGQENPPFFARDGKLSIELNNSLWQFDDLTGWEKTGLHAAAGAPVFSRDTVIASPYAPNAESIVADGHGIFWLVAGRQLYRAGQGLHVACFAPNEAQPFADGRKLAEVLLDNAGGAFLRTVVPSGDEYVFVPARGPVPRATVKLSENNEDGVTLQLAANIPSPRFSWRVDDAPWNPSVTGPLLRLQTLPIGRHRAQVITLDEQLQTAPVPAELSFETKATPAQQIKKWIARLNDNDFAKREAAVAALSRVPDLALPALEKALDQSSGGDRWWLQAALQQVEESTQKSNHDPQ